NAASALARRNSSSDSSTVVFKAVASRVGIWEPILLVSRNRVQASESVLSPPNVLHQLPRPHLPAVHIADRIHCHALGRAGALHLERIGDAVEHPPARRLADADAALPAGVGRDAVRLGVGDVHKSAAQRDAARPPVLLPLAEVVSLQ